MDEQLKSGALTFIAERHDCVISTFRREHDGHRTLKEKISRTETKLKESLSSKTWQGIKELSALLLLEKDSENLYSYVSGIRDSMSLWHYFDAEFLNANYIDLHSGISDTRNNENGEG